jgi:adenosylmethionine-8-amino-7-oxononanoate aminotransferase
MERGLACYPMGGTIDGARGDHVLLAPPFIVSDDDIETLVDRLTGAVDAAVSTARG